MKRFYRRTRNKVLAGVASGLADYFNVDPVWIRVVFVIGTLFGVGSFFLVYIILWRGRSHGNGSGGAILCLKVIWKAHSALIHIYKCRRSLGLHGHHDGHECCTKVTQYMDSY